MEKIKALIAVTLFIAALLFSIGNKNTGNENNQTTPPRTVIIDNR